MVGGSVSNADGASCPMIGVVTYTDQDTFKYDWLYRLEHTVCNNLASTYTVDMFSHHSDYRNTYGVAQARTNDFQIKANQDTILIFYFAKDGGMVASKKVSVL